MGNPSTALGKRKSTRPIILSSDEEGTNKARKNEDSNSTFKDATLRKSHRVSSEKRFTKLARLNSVNDVLTGRSKTSRPLHSIALHSAASLLLLRDHLLAWYDKVKNIRGMPWRKDYDSRLSGEAQSQRAYEVLVSEIMLQQTQITTVIPYYNRWMDAFPTVKALSKATIEDVNQRWKGLGYYSRAARLLAAAQKVVEELDGRFPHTAASMEKQLPGVGRYTAGAVCSIVFNERSPAVDGNVQRLLSRLLAIHAPLKGSNAKAPLEAIWKAAYDLVAGTDRAGAFNQALIELGSTVCKPTNPTCGACPLIQGCTAYQLSEGIVVERAEKDTDIEDLCTMCEPFPDTSSVVTRYPMKIEKKKAREESCAVSVIKYRTNQDRWFLLIRRPEKGL
ncbi:hypothetical protein BS47DRAFT_55017 [Hydnum rufescens UP504]|uniref:Adenine DNA glycosylase n=1 Tax=Hydnum rufescens UP504 TaxID=1448309 RepID=A0A9P6DTI3_9AGAM|nr:hypothetical protein BS47DRAFT_55017 [Hydnum rufescens UP504]